MSAAVLAVLVVLWGVVLVPMWLRRHDKANELAAADRFAGAMRVLSRRKPVARGGVGPDHRYVLMPARTDAARAPQVSAPHDRVTAQVTRPPKRRPAVSTTISARRRRIQARQRGTVAMLLLVVLSLGLAVVVGGPVWAVQGIVDVLAVAGLAHLRAAAVADKHRTHRREVVVAARHATAAPQISDAPVPPVSRPAARPLMSPMSPAPRRPVAPAAYVQPADDIALSDGYDRQGAESGAGWAHVAQPLRRAVGDGLEAAHRHIPGRGSRSARKVLFDADMPAPELHESPTVRRVEAPRRPAGRPVAHSPIVADRYPDDWYERPVPPRSPDRVPYEGRLLDDPEASFEEPETSLLEDILGRAVNE